MGSEELIGSLRRSADEKIRAIWQEAEDSAGKIREEYHRRLSEMHDQYVKSQLAAAGSEAEKIIVTATNKARLIGLSSQKTLSERVFRLVSTYLPLLRHNAYEDVFRAMVGELPRLSWQRVRVNPADVQLAGEYFPGADIIADEAITGGMAAMVDAGKIWVINTFEKRLERGWADILPDLMKDIQDEVSGEGSSSGS
jgi:vacuolar-type H+-ATPase subunit E/Vma4